MIPPAALVRLGLRSLQVHKLRSVLSVLGVVFGVAAVVAMSSVGEGARREAVAQVGALGIDSLTARPLAGTDDAPERGLALSDAASLEAVVPGIVGVAPVREAALRASSPSGREMPLAALGTTPAYARAARLSLAAGRFLADLDVRDRKRAAVLGAAVASRLFPLESALGHWLRLGDDWFEVVGVLAAREAPRGSAGPIRARDLNQVVFVPLGALDHGPNGEPDGVDEIVVRVRHGDQVVAAAAVARATLARTTGGAPVELVVPREILRQRQRTQRIFNVVTGVVAGIGLLVGGIGIMNILLASVAERTREVGVRRAVGATRNDIAAQFLVESTLLTVSGGALGTLLGVVGALAIQALAGWPTALSVGMLLLALLLALAVGLGFGLYPAWRAAGLEPMEALRHA